MEQDEDCQPKDLSMKCNKKSKPIPPPLNLGENADALKEFAILATSPKSPLMQKNLPFRKRAHSLSGTNDVKQTFVTLKKIECTKKSESVIVHHVSTPKINHYKSNENVVPVNIIDEDMKSGHAEENMACTTSTISLGEPGFNSGCVSPLQNVVQSQNISSSPSWNSNLVQLGLPSVSSVLMSPVGSSHEELNSSVNMHPWPAPTWHCFQPGTLIKLEMPSGGNNNSGMFQLAEELGSSDWVGALKVDLVEEDPSALQTCIHFCCLGSGIFITAQCHALHTFFVKNKGWCAVYPEQVAMRYHILCLPLERGDICCPPQTLSPDVCDRFKRFSFPPEEIPLLTPFLLSPPSSPCKKPDSDRPKRPMNAFMLFAKRYRLELIQMHPGKDNRAISVILGEAWRKLPAADKQEYVQEARAMAQEQKRLYPDCWKRKRSHSTS